MQWCVLGAPISEHCLDRQELEPVNSSTLLLLFALNIGLAHHTEIREDKYVLKHCKNTASHHQTYLASTPPYLEFTSGAAAILAHTASAPRRPSARTACRRTRLQTYDCELIVMNLPDHPTAILTGCSARGRAWPARCPLRTGGWCGRRRSSHCRRWT